MLIYQTITVDGDLGQLGALLCCPRCGDGNLHHGRVIVFDRLGEDGERTDVTTVYDGLTATHRLASCEVDNPSGRRGGLVIEFSCECCGDRPLELRIAQHKGNTFVAWRFDPRVD